MTLTTAQRRTHYDDFVAHVRELCTTPRVRKDLAACRGRRVELCPDAGRYLIRHVHGYGARRAHYTVAALIALEPSAPTAADLQARRRAAQPDPPRTGPPPGTEAPGAQTPSEVPPGAGLSGGEAPPGQKLSWRQRPNLGHMLADAAGRRPAGATALEGKLQLLVRLSGDLLHPRLPGLAGMLLQAGCRPDWAVLLDDLALWDIDRPQVRDRWLTAFYLSCPDDQTPHGLEV
jgi:hypothetical protein